MKLNFNYLFQYLEKEKIYIDRTEFEFQIQSHPDYPSLLAISDTLSFFNIDNGAIKIEIDQIELLPNRFVTYLNRAFEDPALYFVECKEGHYFISDTTSKEKITKNELEKRWKKIVLLIDNSSVDNSISTKRYINSFFLILSLLSFFFILNYNTNTIGYKVFLLFPILGLLFTIATLKDLFGAKSELINNFCNITSTTSCESIINSKKWKIFKMLNFSDLGIVFFSYQFFGYLLASVTNTISTFFFLQKIMLLLSLPVIVASLYYQKFVEKKWCPLCLLIILTLILELIFVFTTNISFISNLNLKQTFTLFSVLILTYIAWYYLKELLISNKKNKENLFKSVRFERNYQNFKNNLLVKSPILLPTTPIVLGNKESKIVISIVTNPFCGHCKKAHKIIDAILQKNENSIQVKVIIKVDMEATKNDEEKLFYRTLLAIYKEYGETEFSKALNEWFENKNINEWLQKNTVKSINIAEIDTIYNDLNQWCLINNIAFTPTIFVNNYEYPTSYNRETLLFFINDLIEDSF